MEHVEGVLWHQRKCLRTLRIFGRRGVGYKLLVVVVVVMANME